MTALLVAAGVAVLAAFGIGYVVGRIADAQRQVDNILNKELTRPNLGRVSVGDHWPPPGVAGVTMDSGAPIRPVATPPTEPAMRPDIDRRES